MPKFTIKAPDGTYEVEAADMQQAIADMNTHRQQQMNKSYVDEANRAPEWAKPFMAFGDVGRVGADTLTLGAFDKVLDKLNASDEQSMRTEAAKNRMGWAGTALTAGGAAAALPTAVPRMVGAIGGGPAVRTVTGLLGGAGEGAAAGGVTAQMHGRPEFGKEADVSKGASYGGVGGILGQAVGGLVNKGTRMVNEKLLGKVYEPPTYNVTKLGNNPDPMRRVNVATTEAADAAKLASGPLAKQAAIKNEFGKIDASGFSKNEKEALAKVLQDDIGTKSTKVLGKYVGDKMVAAGATGAGLATGNPLTALAGILASTGGGYALKRGSLGGTQEAAQDLRRLMYGIPKFKGPVSAEAKARLGNVARQLGLDLGPED
jgi:hypothetical protein